MKIVVKSLKIAIFTLLGILFLMFVLPILFPEAITNKVKVYANEKLNGELSFKETKLSFFSHFPSLTLTLDDFLLKGSVPFEKDTLVAAKEIAFGINVKSILFSDKIKIDKIYLSDGFVNVKVNKKGQPNYNVYVSDSNETTIDSSSASIKLERIDIKKVRLLYDDKSTNILIKAKELNYLGKGNLYASIFDLKTKAQIQGFDFTFDNEEYLKNKKVNAELITKINTNSLSLIFKENNLKINKLPVNFIGKFDFLKNGYNLDFTVKSENSQLNDFFTALPPQFVTWLTKTLIKGKTDLFFTLKGKYSAEKNLKPNVHFNMKIREGFIAYNKSPFAAENIFLNLDTQLPSLDTEQLELKIDSIYFDVEKDFFNGNVKWKGMTNPYIEAKIRSKLDLAKLDQAIGFENMKLEGIFSADIVSKGKFIKEKNHFPVTKGSLELKNGFIQTTNYPNPITNIHLKANVSNQSGQLKDLAIQVNPASFFFENKPIHLIAFFKDFDDINYDIKANGELDIERIYKVFSQKGLNVTGYAKMDLNLKGKQSDATNGKYGNLQNSGTLDLKKIKINSAFLPLPFVIEEGNFSFYQDKMNFTNFKASYGKSDFKMNGYMENVINFVLSDEQVLKGNFTVDADFIQLNEFLTISDNNIGEQSTPEFGVVVIPSQFNFTLNANAKKINFDQLNIENLAGKVEINGGKLKLQNTMFSLIGTRVATDAIYFHETPTSANFDYKIKATDFDIKRAYNEIPLFREMASAAEYAEGIVSLDYKIAGKLDGNMTPVFPSLKGGGTLSVKNVKMKGFKLFNIVSQKTETEALKDPDISKIDINTTLKNNIIKIERFKFKVSGFRPRIEGETSFDGKINLKIRIGLPPLGIIGIPIKVTGTQQNPIIGLGRKTEDLQETEYEEGMEDLPKTPEATPTTELPVVTPKDSIKN